MLHEKYSDIQVESINATKN